MGRGEEYGVGRDGSACVVMPNDASLWQRCAAWVRRGGESDRPMAAVKRGRTEIRGYSNRDVRKGRCKQAGDRKEDGDQQGFSPSSPRRRQPLACNFFRSEA